MSLIAILLGSGEEEDIMAANGPGDGQGDGQEVGTGVDRKPACRGPTTYDPLGPEMVRRQDVRPVLHLS